MGLKIWFQVRGGVTLFSKLPYSREFSNMRFKSWLFFLLFLKRFTRFLKISKILFAMQNGVLKFAFETQVYMVLLSRAKRDYKIAERSEVLPSVLILYSSTYIVPSGFRADLHARPEGPILFYQMLDMYMSRKWWSWW